METIEGETTARRQAAAVVRIARSWLADCGAPGWRVMSPAAVVWAVHCNAEGGWPAFVAGELWHAPTVHAALCASLGEAFAARVARPRR